MLTQRLLLRVASVLLGFGFANAIPMTRVEYNYQSGNTTLQRPTNLTPVAFNSIYIGVTELNQTADINTIHSLSDGHHFFQPDWFISDTVDGPAWKYLPKRRNKSTSLETRSLEDESVKIVIDRLSAPYLSGALIDFVDIVERTPFTVEEVSWSVAGGSDFVMDLFLNDAFVTSTISIFGELASIFFNALELFA